jgi:CheY-like chemotaxis protein
MSVSRKVIVAEDDENERFLMRWAFRKAGLEEVIVFARDGQEAIEVLKMKSGSEGGLDARLLLLDIRMPKVDGFQVLEWLLVNASCRPAHVFVLSSSSDPGDIGQAMALGADGYKIKPHGLPAYVKMIKEFALHSIHSGNFSNHENEDDR